MADPSRMTNRERAHLQVALLLLLLVAMVGLLLAPSAGAHASLESSMPEIDEVLEAAPSELLLTFGGTVTAPADEFELLGDDGGIADVTTSGQTIVTVALADDLEPGTHTLAWTVYTDHGEPVRGLLPFHVGERTGGDADAHTAALQGELDDEQRADRLRIGIPALLLAALVLVAMTLRPTWRMPGVVLLLVIGVVAIGLVRRGDGGDADATLGFDARADLSDGGAMQLQVDPAAVGANDVVVAIDDEDGGGAADVATVELRATPSGDDTGSIRVRLDGEGDGRFAARDMTLPVDGTWSLAFTLTRESGDGQQLTLDVPVAP